VKVEDTRRRDKRLDGLEGADFVRCRICGERRRVISGRHLSKHGIEREIYMEEYGLSPDNLIAKDFRRIQSSRRDFQPYSKREWLAAMKAARRRIPSAFTIGNAERRFPQLYRNGLWFFGNWNDALRAAGLDPELLRQRKSWTRDAVIERIRALRKKGVPLSPNSVMKNHQSLFSAAVRQYGSWNQVLIAAGVIKKPIPRKTRFGLLRELGQIREHSGQIPEATMLYLTHYFGSVRNAIHGLETDPKFRAGWSTSKITATLRRMHRSGQSLAYAVNRRRHQALVSAAEAYFGSWGRALHTAGIDPNQYFVRRTWRRRQ
jgi:hypothetical protein